MSWTCVCACLNPVTDGACSNCKRPASVECSCGSTIRNSAWVCPRCGLANPLRKAREKRKADMLHRDLWMCPSCKCTNDIAIKCCASCHKAKPREKAAVAIADNVAQPREEKSTCVVCMSNVPDSVVIPCGHVVLCWSCAKSIKTHCPVCRAKFSGKYKIYFS